GRDDAVAGREASGGGRAALFDAGDGERAARTFVREAGAREGVDLAGERQKSDADRGRSDEQGDAKTQRLDQSGHVCRFSNPNATRQGSQFAIKTFKYKCLRKAPTR